MCFNLKFGSLRTETVTRKERVHGALSHRDHVTGWPTGTQVQYQYDAFLDCFTGSLLQGCPDMHSRRCPSSNELLSYTGTLFCRCSGQSSVILRFSPISSLPGGLSSNALSQKGPLQPVCFSGVPTGALHDPSGLPVLSHAGEC